jgi:hypothetical protein
MADHSPKVYYQKTKDPIINEYRSEGLNLKLKKKKNTESNFLTGTLQEAAVINFKVTFQHYSRRESKATKSSQDWSSCIRNESIVSRIRPEVLSLCLFLHPKE